MSGAMTQASSETRIDPTARIETGAVIGEGAQIGPYCTIGPHVAIGDGCRLVAQVNVTGHTTIGPRTVIHPFASLGSPPQSVSDRGASLILLAGGGHLPMEYVDHPRLSELLPFRSGPRPSWRAACFSSASGEGRVSRSSMVRRGQASAFFFEKKKQKTFSH